MFSPLNPIKQNIITGKIKMIDKDITNFTELKNKWHTKKIKKDHIIQKIAEG